jgi:squalene-associated FAD-dependent desaturase
MAVQPNLAEKPHVIVIGGGFAGTTAAVRLTEQGCRVTLIEARSRLGGRVQSLSDTFTGETIDNGQHLMMGCYEAALRLLDTLGTTHLLRRQKALRVSFAEPPNTQTLNTFFALDASLLPGKLGMALGMMRLQGLSWQEKWCLVRFATRLQLNLVQADSKTAQALLREEKQSERVITRLWEPIILATLNTSVAESSATLFAAVMRLAFFGGAEASQMLLATTGLDEVLSTAEAWLEKRGSRFMTGLVSEILVENSLVCGVRLKNGEEFRADAVVSAVPVHSLLKLLPDAMRSTPDFMNFSEFSTSPILSVYLWFDQEFVEQDFIALLGTTVQWVFNRRKICVAETSLVERFPSHLSLTISAAQSLTGASQQEIIDVCLADLRAVFPKARTATLLHARVIREKNATPLFTPTNGGNRPNAQTALQGLFLAGDWTNTGLPATIESAARSGEIAATQVWASLK